MNRRQLIKAVAALSMSHGSAVKSAIEEKIRPTIEPVRGVHFVLRNLSIDSAYRILQSSVDAGFNSIFVQLSDGVKLEASPWSPSSNAWSKNTLSQWVSDVKSEGLSIVPEIKLLTHQRHFLQTNHPKLMFDEQTYDPQKIEVYKIVYALIDELIDLIGPSSIHIGHDELHNRLRVSKGRVYESAPGMLPAQEFVAHIHRVSEYLDKHSISSWVWGDMFLAPTEFPTVLPDVLGGGAAGYGKPLRDMLSRNVGICDWQYYQRGNFPTFDAFKNEGFRVLGSTWKYQGNIVDFTKYASSKDGEGMLATTWFHVQRKQWGVVNEIIKNSGKAFEIYHGN